MDGDRRPARSRKSVDYSKFGGEDDFENDDDFASFTPPVNAKKKKSSKENKEKTKRNVPRAEEIVELHIDASRKSVNRKSPDEKQFEKELELAMELSKSGVGDINSISEPQTKSTKQPVEPVKESVTVASLNAGCTTVTDSTEIEVLEENICVEPKKTRKTRAPTKRCFEDSSSSDGDDNDDEFIAEEEDCDDSDSDFNPGADGDFEGEKDKKKKNTQNQKIRSKRTKPSITKSTLKDSSNTVNSSKSATLKQQPKKKIGLSQGSTTPVAMSKPKVTSPRTSVNVVSARSPGSALGGVQIKSPSTGMLRVGLSRNIRLKPLHPCAKLSPR